MNMFEMLIKGYYCFLTFLKLKFYHVHVTSNVRGKKAYIYNKGTINLGSKVHLNSFPNGECFRTGLQTLFSDAVITIGNDCILNGTMVYANEKVIIKDNCLFGPGTVICDNDSHRISIDPVIRRQKPKSSPVIIEKNVWIGRKSLILKGVTIGENSIVAAHSVVTKDVPPNTLVAGNPAKIIMEIHD
ncbi:MAG: acyltransferase [Spirochaetales bacterium]|nr:acyltransferase [Spirochaetales bacterium]